MARYNFVWQLALVAVVLCLAGQAQGQIPASNAAVEAAIRNPRYMRRQINCLLDESPCDNVGRTMKRKSILSKFDQRHFLTGQLIQIRRIGAVPSQRPVPWMLRTTTPTSNEGHVHGVAAISIRVQPDLLCLHF